MADPPFEGFPTDVYPFLAELALNNDKEWFAQHKARYESSVREPALAFIRAMGPHLKRRVSKHFVGIDKKVGGSLMRIHRDVRFSADKSPYKTNVGIHFRHDVGKDVHAPGIYVHLEPGDCFLGVGIYHPDREPLAAVRQQIADNPAAWKRATRSKAFRSTFALGGDSLSRAPRGFDAEHELIEDIKRKDFIAVAALEGDLMTKPTAPKEIVDRVMAGKPLLKFLCEALGLES